MENQQCQSGLTGDRARIFEALVFERRSVRKYRPDPVPDGWLTAMLRCAHQTPSPSNSQPVRFVRIRSQPSRERLEKALADGYAQLMRRHEDAGAGAKLRNWINAYHRYARTLFAAPELIALGVAPTVSFSQRLAAAGLVEAQPAISNDVCITVGLALNALILKAQALGVASCILTAPLTFIEDVETLLELEAVTVLCFVTLGFADAQPDAPPRLPLDSVVMEI